MSSSFYLSHLGFSKAARVRRFPEQTSTTERLTDSHDTYTRYERAVQATEFNRSHLIGVFGREIGFWQLSLTNQRSRNKSIQRKYGGCLIALKCQLDVHGRHCMLSYLSLLPISVLRSLDTEAYKFYDRTNRLYDAALPTRCYTQHALRPVIDSKINHARHFIEISFINKDMDFIDLPGMFRDKSVQSSIPNYFKNFEVPSICYKYNKPIRGAIFNFNKLVSDLDIETCNPDS